MSFYKREPLDSDLDHAPENEYLVPCDGDCGGIADTSDPGTVRLGSLLFCEYCASKHPVIVGDVMAALANDEFNERRR